MDTLTRRFGPLIESHCMIVHILHDRGIIQRPLAYKATTFHSNANSKPPPPNIIIQESSALLSDFNSSQLSKFSAVAPFPSGYTISSSPVLFTSNLSTVEPQLRSTQ